LKTNIAAGLKIGIILCGGLLWGSLSACTPTPNFGPWAETPTPELTPTPLPTPVRVFQSAISADGQVVLPLPPQVFSFSAAGAGSAIAAVYVTPGQAVQAGDLVASIDDADLQTALIKAEAALDSLQAQIANEEAPALAGDIAEAQVNLESAQTELTRLQDLPSAEAITQAAADLRLREIELTQAQEAYDQIAYAEGIGMSPQAAELQRATLNYERAEAAYTESTKPATDSQLAAARFNVVQAQNRLDKLLTGPRPETLAANQSRVREAQIQVEEARANLAKANLYAPWDGIITAVNGAPGVSAGNASITAAQIEPLRFATSNFSERNLADIAPGDEATIYLKSFSGVPFPAVVYRVELESTQRDGDTALFTVYLDFNPGEFEIRPGMTGRVEISVEPDS